MSVGAGGYQYNPTASPWTFTAKDGNAGSGIAANDSGFTSGNPPAPEGTQVAFLQGPVTISQVVTAWAGGSYQITFKAAQRCTNPMSQQDFQVLVDGSVVSTFLPSGTSYQDYTTAPFTVSPGDHTITFQGLDTVGGDNTALIDQVAVSPVVEGPPAATDRGFEQVSVGAGEFAYAPAGSPWWTFTPRMGTTARESRPTAAVSGNPPPPQGTQVAFLRGARLVQPIGHRLGPRDLPTELLRRPAGTSNQASQQDFEVQVDGIVVGTFTPSGTTYQTYTTAPFDVDPFVVGPGSHTITFLALDTAGGDNTAFIDDVTLIRLASVADQGFEQVSVGAGQVQARPDRLPLELLRHGRHRGQRQQLHRRQPVGTLRAHRSPISRTTGSFSQDVPGWTPRDLRAELDSRPAGLEPVARGLPGADRRGGG